MIDSIAGSSRRLPAARRHRRSGRQPRTHARSGTARTDRFQNTVRQMTRRPAAPTSGTVKGKRARAQQRERPPSGRPGARGRTHRSDGSRRVSRASKVGTGPGRMPPAPRRGPAPGARAKACRVRAVGQEAAQDQRPRRSEDIGGRDGGHAKSGKNRYTDQARGQEARGGRGPTARSAHRGAAPRTPRHRRADSHTTTEPVRNSAGVKSSAGSVTAAGVSYAKTAAENTGNKGCGADAPSVTAERTFGEASPDGRSTTAAVASRIVKVTGTGSDPSRRPPSRRGGRSRHRA